MALPSSEELRLQPPNELQTRRYAMIKRTSHHPNKSGSVPRRPPARRHPYVRHLCSDCGRIEEFACVELLRAARPRSPDCGGPLNRVGQTQDWPVRVKTRLAGSTHLYRGVKWPAGRIGCAVQQPQLPRVDGTLIYETAIWDSADAQPRHLPFERLGGEKTFANRFRR